MLSMIVYRIPPEARHETRPFSVAGRNTDDHQIMGELFFDAPGHFRLPDDAVLLSTQLCGGCLSDLLKTAQAQYGMNLWLFIEPLCHVFPLPCPDGNGKEISREESTRLQSCHTVYDAPEFLCRYCTFREQAHLWVHLFDTAETISQKLALADALGITQSIVLPLPMDNRYMKDSAEKRTG